MTATGKTLRALVRPAATQAVAGRRPGRNPAAGVEFADRLLDALLRHDEAMLASRRRIDPAVAARLQGVRVDLSADVVSLLVELRRHPPTDGVPAPGAATRRQ